MSEALGQTVLRSAFAHTSRDDRAGGGGHGSIGAVEQAGEFGLTGTHRVAAMITLVSDIVPMGVAAAQGLIAYESFYRDRDAANRAWTARWTSQGPGKVSNMFQAYAYTAALHCLRAIQAAGTDDGDGPTIVAAMKRMPVCGSTTMRQPHRPAEVAACKLAAG